ncbi:MAG: Ig-like domain-containing protein, partial [Candidatus Cloacimonetes bacterium]|nr:Ig-like domain-containing protein [Candidatus Cloacimonadota bacterium]
MINNTSKKSLCVMYLLLIAILIVFLNCKDSNPVNPHITVEKIVLSDTQISLEVGESRKLVVTIYPENATNQEIVWNSNDESVVVISYFAPTIPSLRGSSPENSPEAISNTILITAISEGIAIITATTVDGGFITTCEVIVNPIYPDGHVFSVSNVEEWEKAVNGIKNSGNNKSYTINVIDDFSLHGYHEPTFGDVENIAVEIKGNKTITLISSGSLLYISSQQNISIDETSLEGFISNNVPLVNVIGQNSSLTLNNNAEIKNNGHYGIYIAGKYTEMIMYSGTVTDNGNGGVFLQYDAEFTMHDGNISRNGHAARLNDRDRNFISPVDSISQNISFGGVVIADSSTFTMIGGTISENFANNGAGVYPGYWGRFIMQGGTISENTAERDGGGVYIGWRGGFEMHGGAISRNTARNGGGAHGEFVSIYDGYISDNTALFLGGGVYTPNLFLSGGVISGNSAGENGGGVLTFHYQVGGYDPGSLIGNGIIYGSVESGVPADLANSSGVSGAALYRSSTDAVVKY